MKAFILGSVSTRSALLDSLKAARASSLVKEAYLIWGPYDMLCKVEVSSLGQINTVLDLLYDNEVIDTNTLIVNEEGGLTFEVNDVDKIRKCAYIFIKLKRPAAPRLWDTFLKSIDDVTEAHQLFGMYDVVISVREEAREEYFERVFKRLWLLTEVNLTSTYTYFTLKV
ncbi:MAG: Lrp/AsnC ligand binding domain-containing protein [Nitrososphaerota archaeon]|nr:Lrp/AsnC ligand binding domain-containing protein [Aigarchaeota archaeon]MDW8076303.1 Lrp/AsnC ligand binding domain-containing protein [Nitrososphaerota archaeon]